MKVEVGSAIQTAKISPLGGDFTLVNFSIIFVLSSLLFGSPSKFTYNNFHNNPSKEQAFRVTVWLAILFYCHGPLVVVGANRLPFCD